MKAKYFATFLNGEISQRSLVKIANKNMVHELTKGEALPAICSAVKLAGSKYSTREFRVNTTPLVCCPKFLSALSTS